MYNEDVYRRFSWFFPKISSPCDAHVESQRLTPWCHTIQSNVPFLPSSQFKEQVKFQTEVGDILGQEWMWLGLTSGWRRKRRQEIVSPYWCWGRTPALTWPMVWPWATFSTLCIRSLLHNRSFPKMWWLTTLNRYFSAHFCVRNWGSAWLVYSAGLHVS